MAKITMVSVGNLEFRNRSCTLPKLFNEEECRGAFWRLFAPKVSKLFRTIGKGKYGVRIELKGPLLQLGHNYYIKLPPCPREQFDEVWVKVLHLIMETLEALPSGGAY